MKGIDKVDKLKVYIPRPYNRKGSGKKVFKKNELEVPFIEKMDMIAVPIRPKGRCLIGTVLVDQKH